ARSPLAAGELSPRTAFIAAVVLATIALPLTFLLDVTAGWVLTAYAATMTAYSFGLKRVAILDVIILTGGVVGRAVAGATSIDVEISPWLYVCSSFPALFLST